MDIDTNNNTREGSQISTDISQKNIDIISFFEKDADFVFIYKKTEKLASAVYMVTNLFSDNEPMKLSLRKKVSDLLSFSLSYKDISEIRKSDFINNIKTRVLELVSLLEVSNHGGLVSGMNFSILKREFSSLIESLLSQSVPRGVLHPTLSEVFDSKSISKETNPAREISHESIKNRPQNIV